MTTKTEYLRARAQDVCIQLSQHPVLSRYWSELSVILKGSTARGNTDRYSDIDLVLYASERVRNAVVRGYAKARLTQRQDGIFMFFEGQGYDGHYHIESFKQLERYYQERDFVHAWEYQNVVTLHDPDKQFTTRVNAGTQALFADPLVHIKDAYLHLQLDLDWMRHPLRRGDSLSAWLHAATITRGLCQIAYLLDAHPYPPDKWLAHYLRSTRFGRKTATAIQAYGFGAAKAQVLTPHLTLKEYELYTDAGGLIQQASEFIRRNYGAQPWLDQWYFFV